MCSKHEMVWHRYVMSNLAEYDGHKFFDASKEDLKIGKDKSEKSAEKKLRVQFGVLGLPSAPRPPTYQICLYARAHLEASPIFNWRCVSRRGSTRS